VKSIETLEAVNREARDRLYPALTNPSWLVLRRRREIFRKWFAQLEGRELDVLDVGGRIQPYRPLLEGRLRRYIALDLLQTPLVNIIARGERMPLPSEQFDLVICTQVLEYVPQPGAVIGEILRVLKPGGCLLLSVPSVCPRDSDHECWRFLPASLCQLLSEFRNVEVVAEGGSIVGFFRSINACLNIFARYRSIRSIFRYTVFPVINLAGVFFESLAKSSNDRFAANYSAFGVKPGGVLPDSDYRC
jgi:SAM-dependent methyltransferase